MPNTHRNLNPVTVRCGDVTETVQPAVMRLALLPIKIYDEVTAKNGKRYPLLAQLQDYTTLRYALNAVVPFREPIEVTYPTLQIIYAVTAEYKTEGIINHAIERAEQRKSKASAKVRSSDTAVLRSAARTASGKRTRKSDF